MCLIKEVELDLVSAVHQYMDIWFMVYLQPIQPRKRGIEADDVGDTYQSTSVKRSRRLATK